MTFEVGPDTMYVKKDKGKKRTGVIRVRCLEGESQKAGRAREGTSRLDPQQPSDDDLTPLLENYPQDDGLQHSGRRFGRVYLRATTLPQSWVLNVSVSASHVTSSRDCGNFCRII